MKNIQENLKTILWVIIVIALLVIGIKFIFNATMLVLKLAIGIVVILTIVMTIKLIVDKVKENKK